MLKILLSASLCQAPFQDTKVRPLHQSLYMASANITQQHVCKFKQAVRCNHLIYSHLYKAIIPPLNPLASLYLHEIFSACVSRSKTEPDLLF